MKNEYNQYTDNNTEDENVKSENKPQNTSENESQSEEENNRTESAAAENGSDMQNIISGTGSDSEADKPENCGSSEQSEACGISAKVQHKRLETKKIKAGTVIVRCLCVILTVIILAVLSLLSIIFVLEKGPSPTATRLFVLSVKETSAAGFSCRNLSLRQ